MTAINPETNPYKQTLTQKLLGRNYKWWYIFLNGFKANTAYLLNDIIYFFGIFLGNSIMFVIYKFFTNQDILLEVFFTNFFSIFLTFSMVASLGGVIKSGSITANLIQPTSLMPRYFMFRFGIIFKSYIINFLLFLFTAVFIFRFNLLQGNILILLAYLPIAICIHYFLEWIVGSLAFWTVESYGLSSLFNNTIWILSGQALPLYFFQTTIVYLLPTAFLSSHIVNAYLGKYSVLETVYVFGGGIVWCVILYYLAKWVFKMGLKRNEAVGL